MNDIRVVRPCSIAIDKQPKSNNGNFCSKCTKNVIDFRNLNSEELNKVISSSNDVQSCGTFYEDQVLNSSNDIIDKIVKYFFEVKKRPKIRYRLLMPLLMITIFITSCVSRKKQIICGLYFLNEDPKSHKQEQIHKLNNQSPNPKD